MSEQLSLTVTQALGVVNDRLGTMLLKVEGEVSGFDPGQRYAAFYFSIRDDASTMNVKVWKNIYEASGVALRNGMVVELTGKFNVWAPKRIIFFRHKFNPGSRRGTLARPARRTGREAACRGPDE